MVSTLTLRYRLLALITSGGIAAACGGTVDQDSGDINAGGNSGNGGAGHGGSGGTGQAGIGGSAGTSGTTGGYGGKGGDGTGGYGTGGYGTGGYGTGGYGTGGVGGSATGGTGGVVSCGCPGLPWEACYPEPDVRSMVRPQEPVPPVGVCPSYTSLVQPYSCAYFTAGPRRAGDFCCYFITDSGGCIGRPFVVEGELRRADILPRRDWCARLAASENEAIDRATLRALSESWLDDARLEHASVASFARLTLELLGLGAPPDLVALSQAASLDEIEHARRCFALASRYAGRSLGPGALRVDGATATTTTLAELAVATIHEGCVGETLASLIAAAELEVAGDQDARCALELIAEDEARHAELAWRIVRWAIEAGGPQVRNAVAEAFMRLLGDDDEAKTITLEVDVIAWHAHGRLTPAELFAVRRRAVREVVRPCAEALLRQTAAPEVLLAS